jgi:KaiC/GvpD/RAD55 family RecA-like ATPase
MGNNVGVLWGAPSGWIVDIDLDREDAVQLAPEHLPPTLTYGRASNRRSHWLFHCVGARNKNFEGVDGAMIVEVRACVRQSMFVGSIHPESGEVVEWDDTTTPVERSRITTIEWDDLAGRVELLATRCGWNRKGPRLPAALLPPLVRAVSGHGYAATALRDEINRIRSTAEGGRNDQLNRSAFSLFQLADNNQLDRETVRAELQAAGEAVGLTSAEVATTILSGEDAAREKPRTPLARSLPIVRARSWTLDEVKPSTATTATSDEVDAFLQRTSGKPFGDGIPIPGFPLLTEKLHGLRGTCVFTGPTGKGKTTLVNTIAINVVKGGPGMVPVPVVYFTSEMTRMEIALSMRVMLAQVDQRKAMLGTPETLEPMAVAREELRHLEASGMLSIIDAHERMRPWRDEEHALTGLAETVELLHPRQSVLVVIDTLAVLQVMTQEAFRSDLDNDAAIVTGLKRWTNQLPFGSCILAVHEESKERTGTGDTHAVRGSSKYAYRGTQLIALVDADAKDVGTRAIGSRDGGMEPGVAEFDILVNKARRGGASGSVIAMVNEYQRGVITEVDAWSASELMEKKGNAKEEKRKSKVAAGERRAVSKQVQKRDDRTGGR